MPHFWLTDGRSVFDLLGFDWSLVVINGEVFGPAKRFCGAAQRLGISLEVVDLTREEARTLYGADLLLIRPDQIVAWRGSSADAHPDQLLAELIGYSSGPRAATADSRAVQAG